MNRAEYMAELAIMNARPPQADEAEQKFKRGSRVKITDPHEARRMREWYGVPNDEAIVAYTYRQKFRCGDHNSYSLIMLDEAGKGINQISWFYEKQLEQASEDIQPGLAIIEAYEFGPQS
jgi:hypothetical protein